MSGFHDVDEELVKEAKLKDLPNWKKHVVVLLDEMKLKKIFVCDKHEANVVGFVDVGDFNNQIIELEECSSDFGPHESIATRVGSDGERHFHQTGISIRSLSNQ